ncbi:MAG TPA: hypothetical protein VJC21_04860 [Candidatus Nanoarchaeia archaeon]|nr:hypothetical protein [Candidatus Nanoarchaeia archaeon]
MKTEQIYRVWGARMNYGGEKLVEELGCAQGNLKDIEAYFEEKCNVLSRAGYSIHFDMATLFYITPESLDERKTLLEKKAALQRELSELEQKL